MWAIHQTLAAFSIAGLAGAAVLAQSSGGADRFLQCRRTVEATQRLACYDSAATGFEQAQARGDVLVVDREKLRAVRRQAFGLALSSLDLLPRGKNEAPLQSVALILASAQAGPDGKWSMTASDSAQWIQTDSEELLNPPHAGSTLLVKAGALGGFFCKVDGQSAVRCQRRR